MELSKSLGSNTPAIAVHRCYDSDCLKLFLICLLVSYSVQKYCSFSFYSLLLREPYRFSLLFRTKPSLIRCMFGVLTIPF